MIRLRRAEIDEYIEAHRVKPGDLDHLMPRGELDDDGDDAEPDDLRDDA